MKKYKLKTRYDTRYYRDNNGTIEYKKGDKWFPTHNNELPHSAKELTQSES